MTRPARPPDAYRALLERPSAPVVLRRRDLLAAGVSDTELSTMLRRGIVTRLRHGVYVDAARVAAAGTIELHRLHVAAAIAAAEEPVWAFGMSAALLHGLPLPVAAPKHVELLRSAGQDERALTRRSRHGLVLPDVHVRTHREAARFEQVVDGLPCVDPAVAAVVAGRKLSLRWRVALLDAVLWRSHTTAQRLPELNEEWRSLGGTRLVEDAIARARPGSQSVLETFSRLAFLERGLPEPELQVAFRDDGGLIGYADMYWRDWRVVGEADGLQKYETRDDLVREKRREDRLRALGLIVVRWTWDDLRTRPDWVAAQVRRAGRRAA